MLRTCSRTEFTSPWQVWLVTAVLLILLVVYTSAASDKCCDKDDDYSPCSPNPCQHGGTCLVYDDNMYTCQCKPGYKGQQCEHDSVILSDEKRLIKKLLEDYDHVGIVGRPVHNTSQTIKVGYGLSLIQILDLDEKNQILTTNVWSRYTWKDSILQWDPSLFGGVAEIRVPVHKIWKPDIVLYNYADERLREHRDAMAVVKSDGSVLWLPPVIFRSTCSIDILYFPFDIQNCHMKFGSWTYDGFKLDLDFDDGSEMDISSYTVSNEWSLLDYSGKRTAKTYACCAEPYIDITYSIRVMRIPIFYGYTLIIPCILLSLLTLVSFWLPPETPSKMLLGMNLFLAFFLLLKLLASSTPASSNIPLIGAYFCLNMVLITLSSFLSATIINLYMRADKKNKVPVWIKKIAIDGLSRILCMEQRKCIVKKKKVPTATLR